MKNFGRFILIFFSLVFLVPMVVLAQSTPSATPTSSKSRQIEDLKERLATKVAELAQTQKRALYGTVKNISISTATIETLTKDVKIELTDEITIVQNLRGKRTELAVDDLAQGDMVTVFGDHDATLDILKARVVFIQDPLPLRVAGSVTQIDRSKFTVTVEPVEGPSVVVDIEKTTKTTVWDGETLVKGGFSKIQVGDSVHVIGSAVAKTENRISADRILDLGNMSGQPRSTPTPTSTP